MIAIGTKLYKLRKKRGISQEKLAIDLNLAQSSISNYELGVTNIDIETLEKISNYFEIPITELLVEDNYSFYNSKNKGETNNLVINDLSTKLIEQYDIRLKEKDETINNLKQIINSFKK